MRRIIPVVAMLLIALTASGPLFAQAEKMEVTAIRDTYILKERDQATFKDPLTKVKKGGMLVLIGYYNDYFTVLHNNDTGYVYYLYVDNGIPGLSQFKNVHSEIYQKRLKDEEARRKSEQLAQTERADSKKLELLIKAFGDENGRRVYNKRVWIGMSERMARASIGAPESINTTKTSSSVHEQWVYEDRYLYFKNGILTTIQESN